MSMQEPISTSESNADPLHVVIARKYYDALKVEFYPDLSKKTKIMPMEPGGKVGDEYEYPLEIRALLLPDRVSSVSSGRARINAISVDTQGTGFERLNPRTFAKVAYAPEIDVLFIRILD